MTEHRYWGTDKQKWIYPGDADYEAMPPTVTIRTGGRRARKTTALIADLQMELNRLSSLRLVRDAVEKIEAALTREIVDMEDMKSRNDLTEYGELSLSKSRAVRDDLRAALNLAAP